ncbi:extracellular solute-binding protein [Streptomyces sp. NPDC060053]|uniref:ABC transporter substrate-binding protein n=1 Tax=Streptomyces sp. NPDC060053 TaxID=3347047 RepID=UPI0036BEFB52
MPQNTSTPMPGRSSMSRRLFLTTTGALSLGAALTACGGDDSGGSTGSGKPVGQADIDTAMKTPTELTFWTWVPNIDKEVALFEKRYPAIKVKVVNAGQGTPQYTKLRTALKAGSGAPDLVQIEYQAIPTFTITDSLLDLRPYGAAALKSTFVDWTWSQVSGGDGEIWAIPQDTGPMGMLYRQDIFDRHGIEVPGTWDEFAAAARKLHKADPDVYLTNLAANQVAAWHGLLWQAGAKPYVTSGKSDITISVDDSVSRKLAAYWGGLAKEGVIGVEPDFTDSWYAALNKGKYATWITAAWGPVFLSGSAKATAGSDLEQLLPAADHAQRPGSVPDHGRALLLGRAGAERRGGRQQRHARAGRDRLPDLDRPARRGLPAAPALLAERSGRRRRQAVTPSRLVSLVPLLPSFPCFPRSPRRFPSWRLCLPASSSAPRTTTSTGPPTATNAPANASRPTSI